MIKWLSERIVSWQIRKKLLASEEEALYRYAYELLISQAVNVAAAILVAWVFHAPAPVIAFLITYIPLRSFAGGYHADSHGACAMVSAAFLCLACSFVKAFPAGGEWIFILVSLCLSGPAVLILAPVEDPNKRLDQAEKRRYRVKSREIWLLEEIFLFGSLALHQRRIGLSIAFAHLILALMLLIGYLKNRHIKAETVHGEL